MLPMYKTLMEMIDLAMQEKAPQMYKNLRAQGALQAEIRERANLAKETYLEIVGVESMEVIQRRQMMPYLDQMAALYQRNREATEIALAQAIEFPSESGTDSTIWRE